jgi:hypothetical protein
MKVYSKPFYSDVTNKWVVEVHDENNSLLSIEEFDNEADADALFNSVKQSADLDEKAELEVIELSEEQQQQVRDLWNSRPKDNPPSLMELTKAAFGKPNLDGRTKEGRAVKKMLAGAKLRAPVAGEYKVKGLLKLTDEQKEYIENNCSTMKAVEMARELFKNPALSNRHQETLTVLAYLKTLAKPTFEDPADITDKDYRPPKSFDKVLAKINKYRHEQLDKEKLTGKQKKDIQGLLGYMNCHRYVYQINIYDKEEDRILFESTFVRCCYDKYDLTEEEVDQYILYATEVVTCATIHAQAEQLRRLLDEEADKDATDRKIAMGLVDAIDTTQQEYDKCISRQNRLLDALKVKRSEKEGKSKDGAANIINLIQTWRDEDTRKRLLKYAAYRKEKLKQGVDEMMTMDEIHARIMGLSYDEAING